MKNIDNDMDDLFNKAGQDYPLNTEKKNWEAVYKELHPGEAATPAAKNKWYRFLLPFVLLISVPAVIYLTGVGSRESEVGSRESEVGIRESGVGSRKPEGGNRKIGIRGSEAGEQKLAKNRTPEITDSESGLGRRSPGVSGSRESEGSNREIGISGSEAGEQKVAKNQISEIFDSESGRVRRSPGVGGSRKKQNPEIFDSESGRVRRSPGVGGNRESGISNAEVVSDKKTTGDDMVKTDLLENFFRLPETLFLNNIILNNNGSPSENIKQPIKHISVPQPAEIKPAKTNLKKTTGFYYGLVAAVDLSTVKMQAVKHPGSSVGLMAGYQFTPHWSVELSGKWSTKKYYSDGKYFDKTGANIPDYVNVFDLTGGCNMFEFPVNVRYLFTPGQNSFFATAGVSSYFMNKEAYEYTADAGSGMYEGYRNYRNSGNHVFSNLQLTGGYQFKLFSKTNLRIEPYVLLPLKKVGVGRMPITSAGVQFGLMRITR